MGGRTMCRLFTAAFFTSQHNFPLISRGRIDLTPFFNSEHWWCTRHLFVIGLLLRCKEAQCFFMAVLSHHHPEIHLHDSEEARMPWFCQKTSLANWMQHAVILMINTSRGQTPQIGVFVQAVVEVWWKKRLLEIICDAGHIHSNAGTSFCCLAGECKETGGMQKNLVGHLAHSSICFLRQRHLLFCICFCLTAHLLNSLKPHQRLCHSWQWPSQGRPALLLGFANYHQRRGWEFCWKQQQEIQSFNAWLCVFGLWGWWNSSLLWVLQCGCPQHVLSSSCPRPWQLDMWIMHCWHNRISKLDFCAATMLSNILF